MRLPGCYTPTSLAVVATRGYNERMTTVGVRELKNRLSHYLRLVRGGETLVVTDRGEIIAELKPPQQEDFPYPGLLESARKGLVRLGTGNNPNSYPEADFSFPAGTAARLLEEDRGDR